jgi:hypothetical protein
MLNRLATETGVQVNRGADVVNSGRCVSAIFTPYKEETLQRSTVRLVSETLAAKRYDIAAPHHGLINASRSSRLVSQLSNLTTAVLENHAFPTHLCANFLIF